jgi:hypothetical protein
LTVLTFQSYRIFILNTNKTNTLSLPLEAGDRPCWKAETKLVTDGLCCCTYTIGTAIPIAPEVMGGTLSKYEKEA